MSRRTSSVLRIADRYVGIPLIAAFALVPKRRRPPDEAVRHIGILKTAAIGDTLLLAGIPDALKSRFPAARVTLVCGPSNAAAANLLGPAVDEVVTIDPMNPLSALARLRTLSLDVMLECGPWPRLDALLGVLSGARYVVGFRAARQGRHHGFDRVVQHDSNAHQLENFRALARAIGVESFPEPRLIGSRAAPSDWQVPASYVVFHPWSGGYMGEVKEWRTSNWVELGRRLQRDGDTTIVISGGPADVERSIQITDALEAAGCDARNLAGRFSLVELSSILLSSRAVISVNTGVMHLAALLGVPTLSLEGPVPVKRWGPIGPSAHSVVTSHADGGYLDLGFEYRGRRLDSMDGITVDAVVHALADLLS